MEVKILPLNKFRRLKEFSKYFKITKDTVIAYDNTIYSNKDLPEDIIIHEMCHLRQQKEYGLQNFTKQYLNNKEFRLKVEGEAYKIQLESIKHKGLREAVRKDSINGLVSGLYGKISLQEAKQLLK